MIGAGGTRAAANILEGISLILCAAILAWQLLLPGFIGMANNGDFPKMAGRLCLASADHETERFDYFQPDYVREAAGCYNPHIPSSEIVPVWLAAKLERTFGPKRHFDIRWLSTLHALLFTSAYYLVLLMLRPLNLTLRSILSLAALWIFADVSVVAYMNSFYTDVPAILGGLAAIALGVMLASGERTGWAWLVPFGLAALVFVTSKSQHAATAPVSIAAAACLGWRSRDRRARIAAVMVCVILTAGMVFMLAGTPTWYVAQSRFNLIFSKIAPMSKTTGRDLVALGLDADETRYAGMGAFTPGSPTSDPIWFASFRKRTGYGKVFGFYLRHPALALTFLWADLQNEAPKRRIFGNFPKRYGRPPGAQAQRLGTWSELREWLFRVWPGHAAVWYALALLGAPLLARRDPSRLGQAVLWTIAAVALVGAIEFCTASLADAFETDRHLWMFHFFTDASMFLTLLWLATKASYSSNIFAGSTIRVARPEKP